MLSVEGSKNPHQTKESSLSMKATPGFQNAQRQNVRIPLFQKGLNLHNVADYNQDQSAFDDEQSPEEALQPQDFTSAEKQHFGNSQ